MVLTVTTALLQLHRVHKLNCTEHKYYLWNDIEAQFKLDFKIIEVTRVILNIKQHQEVLLSKLFNRLKWMTINQLTSILIYKIINKPSPDYLQNSFQYVKDRHQVDARWAASGDLSIPKLCSKTGQRLFLFRGVHAWNNKF